MILRRKAKRKMKTKLLSKLRKEAKNRFYLYPWKCSGQIDEVIVIEKEGKTGRCYYGIKESEVDCYGVVRERISTWSGANITKGYSLNEGIELLHELRRNYILDIVHRIKSEKESKLIQQKYASAKKELKKY